MSATPTNTSNIAVSLDRTLSSDMPTVTLAPLDIKATKALKDERYHTEDCITMDMFRVYCKSQEFCPGWFTVSGEEVKSATGLRLFIKGRRDGLIDMEVNFMMHIYKGVKYVNKKSIAKVQEKLGVPPIATADAGFSTSEWN